MNQNPTTSKATEQPRKTRISTILEAGIARAHAQQHGYFFTDTYSRIERHQEHSTNTSALAIAYSEFRAGMQDAEDIRETELSMTGHDI